MESITGSDVGGTGVIGFSFHPLRKTIETALSYFISLVVVKRTNNKIATALVMDTIQL